MDIFLAILAPFFAIIFLIVLIKLLNYLLEII